MPQTLLHLLQAMLKGLIEQMAATDAAIALPDSSETAPHLLVRVGRMDASAWHALLQEQPVDLLQIPLKGWSTDRESAQLCVYRQGRSSWGRASRLAASAIAAGVEYLLKIPGDNFDWMQLVASRRILSVTEEELTRIVLDIHDGPVQKLFAALNRLIHLRAIVERHERIALPTQSNDLLPDLIQAIDLLEVSLGEIRTFLGAFQSSDMEERVLLDILEALILQHEQLTGATVHFAVAAPLPSVSVPVKIALYRILQEALSNVHRHAQVKESYVKIWQQEEYIHMEIRDRGRGFTPPILVGPSATEAAQHIGLRGMRDRVHLVGGSLYLISKPGEGTRIEVSVPIS